MRFNALSLQKTAPLLRGSRGADVIDLFACDEDISGCAIVDENRIPVGYIDRNAFVTKVSSLYGRALYDNRPAETLSTQNYRVVSIDSRISDAIGLEPSQLDFDRSTGLIVVDQLGRYLGLTHAFALTQALLRDNQSLVQDLKREVADREAAEKAMRDMAERDELTGLYNRRRFLAEIKKRVERKAPTLLVYLDLNKFKAINDTHGHAAGDYVLSTVANRMKKVAGDAVLARLGGDEFAIIQEVINHRAALATRLLQLETAITQPIKRADGWLEVGVAMGAAQFPHDFDCALSLIDGADQTMLSAKSDGTGYKIYSRSPTEGDYYDVLGNGI
ncbi:MAG: GGDEF domain-containing protein [Pseudomonadota bacterium]